MKRRVIKESFYKRANIMLKVSVCEFYEDGLRACFLSQDLLG